MQLADEMGARIHDAKLHAVEGPIFDPRALGSNTSKNDVNLYRLTKSDAFRPGNR